LTPEISPIALLPPPFSPVQKLKKSSLLGLTPGDLAAHPALESEAAYRARQIFSWVYARRRFSFEQMTDLPAPLRNRCAESFSLDLPAIAHETGAPDETRKFLLRLRDGCLIETVLLSASPALYGAGADRRTLCVSTQVGCAYGCRFCASGLRGWTRDLDAGEIVSQVLAAECRSGDRIDNIVFMGMGEPLANYRAVLRAAEILNASWGMNIGARRMTISTCGLVPGILKLAGERLGVRLAVSLHGATDDVRGRFMPVNRRYGISSLMDACRVYSTRTGRRLTFEYVLIAGVNDHIDQARILAAHARTTRARVNLIPCNPVEGLQWQRPSEADQERFLQTLARRGVTATLRREKGGGIQAACGQLRLQTEQGGPPPSVSS